MDVSRKLALVHQFLQDAIHNLYVSGPLGGQERSIGINRAFSPT